MQQPHRSTKKHLPLLIAAIVSVVLAVAVTILVVQRFVARIYSERALAPRGGLPFTLRLKYYEFVVLETFCPWCAVSATTITLQSALVVLDWRRVSGKRDPE